VKINSLIFFASKSLTGCFLLLAMTELKIFFFSKNNLNRFANPKDWRTFVQN
jgi:hypothetical protein